MLWLRVRPHRTRATAGGSDLCPRREAIRTVLCKTASSPSDRRRTDAADSVHSCFGDRFASRAVQNGGRIHWKINRKKLRECLFLYDTSHLGYKNLVKLKAFPPPIDFVHPPPSPFYFTPQCWQKKKIFRIGNGHNELKENNRDENKWKLICSPNYTVFLHTGPFLRAALCLTSPDRRPPRFPWRPTALCVAEPWPFMLLNWKLKFVWTYYQEVYSGLDNDEVETLYQLRNEYTVNKRGKYQVLHIFTA